MEREKRIDRSDFMQIYQKSQDEEIISRDTTRRLFFIG